MLTHHSRNHHERNSPGYSGAWYTPILGLGSFQLLFFWIVTLPNCPFKPGAGTYKHRYYLKNYLLGAHHNRQHLKARWLTTITVSGFYRIFSKKSIFNSKKKLWPLLSGVHKSKLTRHHQRNHYSKFLLKCVGKTDGLGKGLILWKLIDHGFLWPLNKGTGVNGTD